MFRKSDHQAPNSVVLAYVSIAIAVVSWAAAFPAISYSLIELAPVSLATVRFGMAATIALAWLVWVRPKLPSWPHAFRFAICGFLGSTLYNVFINIGQTTVSAGAASFITNIIPVLTALAAWLMLGERFRLAGWLGCLIGFAGVSYIAFNQPGGLSFGGGAIFIILASMCSAAYFVLQKPLIVLYGALPCTAFTLIASSLFLLPWMPEAAGQFAQASLPTMIAVLGLALFPTLLAYCAATYALGQLPAGLTANFIYLVAPLAACLAFLFLGEIPSVSTVFGGAMATVGTSIVAKWGTASR